jgi:hypothetical protein
LSFNGRITSIINWGNTGTLPTLGDARWYSGVWPNDTTNNGTTPHARFMSGYFDIPATGGSGYTYGLTLFYDSSMLGKVTNESFMVINKRQHNVPGSWTTVTPSSVNVNAKSITINNQASFSEFTATDAAATLPLTLLNFVAAAVENDVQLQWEVIPGDEKEFIVERSIDGRTFKQVIVINATGQSLYKAIDRNAMQLSPGGKLYYRLRLVSKTGEEKLSRIVIINPGRKDILLSVSPNPFEKALSITVNLDKASPMALKITDNAGRVVYTRSLHLAKGLHKLTLEDLAHLPGGVYRLQLVMGSISETINLLKL